MVGEAAGGLRPLRPLPRRPRKFTDEEREHVAAGAELEASVSEDGTLQLAVAELVPA